MARSADSLSIVEARRLACAAQGFGLIDRSSPTTKQHVVDVFTRLGERPRAQSRVAAVLSARGTRSS
ncbi:MAG: hypothetical protein EBY93_01295, partial [Actinobacteria bacterium]|nr:hypothetical protein [Actinomycetota bacterium]